MGEVCGRDRREHLLLLSPGPDAASRRARVRVASQRSEPRRSNASLIASSAAVFVATVADRVEEVARARSHALDARVILGVEREVADAKILRHMLGLAKADSKNHTADLRTVENRPSFGKSGAAGTLVEARHNGGF